MDNLFRYLRTLLNSLFLAENVSTLTHVQFTVLSVVSGVVGYMTFLNVSVDSVSIITIIMSIGFAVDLSAHISYAFVKSEAATGDARAVEALETLAWPVFQVIVVVQSMAM